MSLETHDAFGRVRTDFSEAEIESITDPAMIKRLAALVTCARELNDAEAAFTALDRSLNTAKREIDEALADKAKEHPAMTAHEAWKRDVAGIIPESEPVPNKTLAECDEKIEHAQNVLDHYNHQRRPAGDRVKLARANLDKALTAWQAEFTPVTRETLIRDVAAADAARAEANKKAGLPLNHRGPTAKPKSMIDAVANNGIGGDVNVKGGHGFRRGAYPQYLKGQPVPKR